MKGYWLYNRTTRKVFVNWNVTFYEDFIFSPRGGPSMESLSTPPRASSQYVHKRMMIMMCMKLLKCINNKFQNLNQVVQYQTLPLSIEQPSFTSLPSHTSVFIIKKSCYTKTFKRSNKRPKFLTHCLVKIQTHCCKLLKSIFGLKQTPWILVWKI